MVEGALTAQPLSSGLGLFSNRQAWGVVKMDTAGLMDTRFDPSMRNIEFR